MLADIIFADVLIIEQGIFSTMLFVTPLLNKKLLPLDCCFSEESSFDSGDFTQGISHVLTLNMTWMGSFSGSSQCEPLHLWHFYLHLKNLLGEVISWEFCYMRGKSFKHRQYHFDTVISKLAMKLFYGLKFH